MKVSKLLIAAAAGMVVCANASAGVTLPIVGTLPVLGSLPLSLPALPVSLPSLPVLGGTGGGLPSLPVTTLSLGGSISSLGLPALPSLPGLPTSLPVVSTLPVVGGVVNTVLATIPATPNFSSVGVHVIEVIGGPGVVSVPVVVIDGVNLPGLPALPALPGLPL